MEEMVPGSVGTSAGFALRLGQAIFSTASLLFMSSAVDFYSFTAFCYLVIVMGLLIPWSLTLAMVDACSLFVKGPPRQRGIILFIVVGDWVLSFLTLAASSSAASVTDLMLKTGGSLCLFKSCRRYQLSATIAFLSWFLLIASSLFNLWRLPSL
ncbi:hypothetical protein L1049_025088 [Liquidambar formosana]|uniref:CASP-like protein n=1 Tax=Liquidambar formosana TaxID=63359 RepID=A0AAP0S211_LIQFO